MSHDETAPRDRDRMSHHRSWRERISGRFESGTEPVFEASADPTLVAFARLFLESELVSFDANKRLRTDALSPLYDCQTESVRAAGGPPELFVAIWTPVWPGTDPLGGFHTGQDSAYLGTTLPVAMPPDERTDALLLLVTTAFIHLSGVREGSDVIVRGAIDDGDDQFRYLALADDAQAAVSAPTRSARRPGPASR